MNIFTSMERVSQREVNTRCEKQEKRKKKHFFLILQASFHYQTLNLTKMWGKTMFGGLRYNQAPKNCPISKNGESKISSLAAEDFFLATENC